MDEKSFNIRIPKRWARVCLVVVVTALIVAPLTAIASHSFTDVPDSNIFHDDIEWLKDSGVTRGCNPPSNTEFCPKDNVTREAMAAFMRRFAQYIDAEDGTPALADTVSDGAVTHAKLANNVIAARAYGNVFHNGSVADSRNLTSENVSTPEVGVYCIFGLSFTPNFAVVSPTQQFNSGLNDVRVHRFDGADTACPENTQVQVHVFSPGSSTRQPGNFAIVIYD